MEIEKKFLVSNVPDLKDYKNADITQSYISFSPEVRIRKKGNHFFLTQKDNGTVVREEKETEINEDSYNILLILSQGNVIEKTRYEIPLTDGVVAELDIYHGKLNRLITVETEFESEKQAEAFSPPEWFGKDVTFDKRYKNKNLARCESIDWAELRNCMELSQI